MIKLTLLFNSIYVTYRRYNYVLFSVQYFHNFSNSFPYNILISYVSIYKLISRCDIISALYDIDPYALYAIQTLTTGS